jgi:hypothetical protein
MDIALATRGFGGFGGSETYLLTIGEQLQKLGHEVLIHADFGALCPSSRRVAGSG